jgi:hypothetical protein
MTAATGTEPMIMLAAAPRPIRRLTPKEAALRMLHDIAHSGDTPEY